MVISFLRILALPMLLVIQYAFVNNDNESTPEDDLNHYRFNQYDNYARPVAFFQLSEEDLALSYFPCERGIPGPCKEETIDLYCYPSRSAGTHLDPVLTDLPPPQAS